MRVCSHRRARRWAPRSCLQLAVPLLQAPQLPCRFLGSLLPSCPISWRARGSQPFPPQAAEGRPYCSSHIQPPDRPNSCLGHTDVGFELRCCLGKPCFPRLIPGRAAGTGSLRRATLLEASEMRLGWVKLPGISVSPHSWLQPLQHLSSWRRPRASRDAVLHHLAAANSTQPQPEGQAAPSCSRLPSPVSCSGNPPPRPPRAILGELCHHGNGGVRPTDTHPWRGADASQFLPLTNPSTSLTL